MGRARAKRASVVIASRNKPTYLAATLSCLARQTVEPDEVIVVDDASDPPLPMYPGVTHWMRREGTPHLQASRNRAIASAQGEVVLLIDDDCLVPPHWLESHLLRHRLHPGHLVVGSVRRVEYRGEVEFWKLPPAIHVDEHRTFERRCVLLLANAPPWNLAPCSNNASLSRELLLKVGAYDEEYYGWGVDDVDLTYRLMKGGMPLLIDSVPEVFHQEHPREKIRQGEQERRNLGVFARRHGFWPYGQPPRGYEGPCDYPPQGAWFHARAIPGSPKPEAIRVTSVTQPGPYAPRQGCPLDWVLGRPAMGG
jgi:glycosyltransferase involved in cell wall biosynthesis